MNPLGRSGEPRVIRDVLNLLLKLSKNDNILTEDDPTRMRPSDVQILHGDCSKFKEQTGWEPEIPFEKTMGDLLEFWRGNL